MASAFNLLIAYQGKEIMNTNSVDGKYGFCLQWHGFELNSFEFNHL